MKKIASLVLVVLLAGCGETANEGIVISKNHHDAYDTYSSYCAAYDEDGYCTWRIPTTEHHSERWTLTIQDCRKAIEDGKQPPEAIRAFQRLEHCLTGEIDVGSDWDNYEIGEWYGGDKPPGVERTHDAG